MVKVTNSKTGDILYYLTEQERVSLATDSTRQFIAEKLKNIEKYRKICGNKY